MQRFRRALIIGSVDVEKIVGNDDIFSIGRARFLHANAEAQMMLRHGE
jgi:hypothetical protein